MWAVSENEYGGRHWTIGRTLSIGGMIRAAGYVVAEYWRKELRRPPIVSLNGDVEDSDGNTVELIETVANSKRYI